MDTRRALAPALSVCLLAACGEATLRTANEELTNGASFVQVARGALSVDAGVEGVASAGDENFYLAIHRNELGSRWFLSAYLTQWHPSEQTPMQSLGTRVVSFKVQNGKLFVFDATDGKAWSDTLDPSVLIEAWPIVTTYTPFNRLSGASNYVLVDPSAGLNRFSVVGDATGSRFQTELTYLQRYRTLADGVSFEEVFTGYSEWPDVGTSAQPWRGSGTLSFTLRRYAESPGFQATELSSVTPTGQFFFGSSNLQYVKNEAKLRRNAVKWNLRPGMTPIPWRISRELTGIERDPRLAGVDVRGAITRGVESWNQAFGFPVVRVVPTGPDDSPGDDDKNFVVVDRNPGSGLAFANWRENPNTGEIRGASVYFSAAFIEGALLTAPDAGSDGPDSGAAPVDSGVEAPDAGTTPDAGTAPDAGRVVPCSPELVISQLFGGNSTTGLNQDYVELHNRSGAPVSLAGLSLQYASATGASWQVLPLAGTVPAGGFFLVGLSTTTDGGVPLPVAPDLVGSLSLSASSGKVALVSGTVALAGCPAVGMPVVDLVGYGGASCAEGAVAPVSSAATALFRRDPAQACSDTNSNWTDFLLAAPAPRNTASPPALCTCAAPAGPLDPPVSPGVGDGGVQLVLPPVQRPAARLAWDSMPQSEVCAYPLDLRDVAIPAGMTRSQYVEAVITHTIAHEVGHTFGLRHNFKGSLGNTSVMDYLRDEDSILLPEPGPYDVAAVRYLYGLDPAAPTQPFCTDHQAATDATCDRWDSSATPLTTDVVPAYQAAVRATLAGTGSVTYGQIWRVTRYVRAPTDEAQRLQAFNLLLEDVAPPIRAEVTALGPNANFWADQLTALLLSNLFLDPSGYRDEVGVSPALGDAAFRARVIAVAKSVLVNSDSIRDFSTRRVAIDALKALQTYDAYQALVEARATLVAERARYNALGQALVDDLLRRLDLACSPYFR